MSSFYLAARFGRREELLDYARSLSLNGHSVTSRWLTQHQVVDLHAGGKVQYEASERQTFALHDYEDVCVASRLIAFTEDPLAEGVTAAGRRGGRHVELGLALAWGKLVYVVGHRENVFCHLPQVMYFPTFNKLLESL